MILVNSQFQIWIIKENRVAIHEKKNILDHITSCQMIKSQHFLYWLTEILDFEQLKPPNKLHVIRATEWFL